MTTWTTEDLANVMRENDSEYVGIPFFGWVKINEQQDKEDKEAMLRQQILILQAECQRLKRKLMENGIQE